MSAIQNTAYALIQVAHNLGAVAAAGGSLAALKFRGQDTRSGLARLVLAGLATQGLSGAAFGAVSYHFYGRFPDISGIAVDALEIKIACVVIGCLLLTGYVFLEKKWSLATINACWIATTALTFTALCSAAFLRWFS